MVPELTVSCTGRMNVFKNSGCLLESMIQRLNPLQLHPYLAQVIRQHQVSWQLISLEKQVEKLDC